MAAQTSTSTQILSTPPSFDPRPTTHDPRQLFRAAGIMGVATSASRVLGFLRDCMIAAFYGTSMTAQAFLVAFRVPNLLRDLVGEGAANTAFVPVFSKTRTLEGKDSWGELAQAVWVRLLTGFLLFSVVGILAAPWIVPLIAPGFGPDQELMNLTIRLTRILFPFVGLVGLTAFFMGLLNSVHHFTLPALGPVLLNIGMISGMLLWRRDALGLSWGVIAGGLLQLVIQWPALVKQGIHLSLKRCDHPGVEEIRRLVVPRVTGTAVYQVSVLVDTIFASFGGLVGKGGVAALYFAHRFLHLPLALFGISVAQAALPTMASFAAQEDLAAVKKTCLASLRGSLFIALPASVGLIVLGHPIIATLLERGAFSPQDTDLTASALGWYAVGLASFCVAKVLTNVLYALGDTWTPVRLATVTLLMNVVLNLLLVWPMGLGGLALATSLSSFWNSFHLYRKVRDRVGQMSDGMRPWLLKVSLASLGMGAVALLIWNLTRGSMYLGLFLAIASGLVSFFLLSIFLNVEEALSFRQWLTKRQK